MSSDRLAGRRIVVTGGASGIGAATVELFVREGAAVAVMDRDLEGASRIASAHGAEAFAVEIGQKQSVEDAVEAAAQTLGGLDGIVNAAGIAHDVAFRDTSPDLLRLTLDVNLVGPFMLCQAALPYLARNASATIVNIASIAAIRPNSGRSAYAASKGGLVSLTKVLAAELAPKVRVNVICPGAVDTPMTRSDFSSENLLRQARERHALHRIAMPQEIADGILFLTSAESAFVTGTTLVVDGGRTYY